LISVKNWSLPHRGSNAGTQESDFDDAVVYLNRMSTDFVFILADDLGYADLGRDGGRTLDRLAADGLREAELRGL
jgi:hypothetical protein